jgi:putative DNA primase/helicase
MDDDDVALHVPVDHALAAVLRDPEDRGNAAIVRDAQVRDRLKWMDQNQRMNGAEVQIGYDGDRPKVYPWDRARDQLERVVASLKKSAREAGFGADLDPTLEQLQSATWTRFREARAAALAQARERAGREPGGSPDR